MRATLIAGLPGSGKTTLAKRLVGQGDILIDDPRSFSNDVLPHLGHNLVITDPHLCNSNIRNLAKERLLKEGYVVFEILLLASPDICWERVKSRNDGRKIMRKELDYFYARLNS